ncbi:MAG TPA: aromatic-ring-hydroxylating dioxygenase subunit beta [Stellaceae bacterium]|nr:aromatic-ring-hydroxylating dioxygenase subunit beta [Stellaceae bacterium]
MIAAPGLDVPNELRLRLADLYCAYADALDEGEIEAWPEFFTADCLYKIIPRENFEQGLPIALIFCESRDMLIDRVTAIRETALFVPRLIRHLTGNVRLRAIGPDGFRLTASFALFQTMADRSSELFMCGRYHDLVVDDGARLRFAERICVYDSTIVPTSLVYPV